MVDIAAVHKLERDLNIHGFKRFVYTHIFGFSGKDFDIMWDVSREAHRIDTKWLMGKEQQDRMTAKYFTSIEEQIKGLNLQIDGAPGHVLEVDGLITVVDLEGKATIATMYGETTLRRNPRLLDDLLFVVTNGFWSFMFGLPRFMAKKAFAARDRIIESYSELADELESRGDISGYFRERFGYVNAWGVDRKAVGSDMFRNMFA